MTEEAPARAVLQKRVVIVMDPDRANRFYQRGCYGKPLSGGRLQLSPVEALYLVENGKIIIEDQKGNKLDFETLMKKFAKTDPEFRLKYVTYADLRSRGYIVRTGLKFGAHFRVYDRGDRPGEAHSKFLVHAIPGSAKFGATELVRAVRLAHGVRKRFIWAIVDEEGDITYYAVTRERL